MPKVLKTIIILLGLLTISIYLYTPPQPSKTTNDFFKGSKNIILKPFTKEDTLQYLMNEELKNKQGTWAVAVKNLKNQKTYYYNENHSFSSASLYKLAVMWATFDQINHGKITVDQSIGNTTVNDALGAMISVSDNDTAIALAETIGWAEIDSNMKREGLDGFILIGDDPKVTAKSVLDFFDRVYVKTAVTKEYSEEMTKLLLSQKINDRIPKYLPEEVNIAHKTGELDYVRHDAGIVYGKKADYIFVFLTDTPQPGNTPEEIALLSKMIYEDLEK